MKLPRWTSEPLVHFLIAGLLIYFFFALRGGEVDPASRVIKVDRETQAQIALGFERLMSRSPTDAELDAQIDRFIREEVLYREALRLGLDQGDAIVRRRLAQKMDLIASAQAETMQPTDEILREWMNEHPERFSEGESFRFDQLWFATERSALAAQEKLQAGNDWRDLGERISLPQSLSNEGRDEILALFGERFVSGLDELEAGAAWRGPMISGFGWHLVRLNNREAGAMPPFDQIRDEVENDWRNATIADRREQGYQILREAYRVEIER